MCSFQNKSQQDVLLAVIRGVCVLATEEKAQSNCGLTLLRDENIFLLDTVLFYEAAVAQTQGQCLNSCVILD